MKNKEPDSISIMNSRPLLSWWWPLKIVLLGLLVTFFPGCGGDSEQRVDPAQTIEANDGVRIIYENYGDGDTAVVLLHCWTCDRTYWQYQVEPLAAAGYRVVTLDLPGHGDSGTDRDSWTIDALANDVVAVSRALNLENVILVGHSMGAPVSLATAHKLPGIVKGIVAVDALHNAELRMPEEAIEHFQESMRVDFDGTIQNFFPLFFPEDTDPELIEWILGNALAADPLIATALMEDLVRLDEAALMESAGVPVRSINAVPYSEMAFPTSIETNRKYADFDAVEMDGVGHFLQLEQPDVFNRHLLDILAELTGSEAEKTLSVTRVFDAPVEEVWKAWSESEYVKQWWGPHGFTAPVAEMDFREGGTSLVAMRAPQFGDIYNTWTYTHIVPNERVEFISRFTDPDGNHISPAEAGLPEDIPYEVPHVIAFKALDEGSTEITVIESGYTSDQTVELSKAGLEQCLDKMAAIFASH